MLCSNHELQKARDREAELVEEINTERPEERGGHVRKQGFQVTAVTTELKSAEVRKSDLNCDRYMRLLAFDLTIGYSGPKAYLELLQVRQE